MQLKCHVATHGELRRASFAGTQRDRVRQGLMYSVPVVVPLILAQSLPDTAAAINPGQNAITALRGTQRHL